MPRRQRHVVLDCQGDFWNRASPTRGYRLICAPLPLSPSCHHLPVCCRKRSTNKTRLETRTSPRNLQHAFRKGLHRAPITFPSGGLSSTTVPLVVVLANTTTMDHFPRFRRKKDVPSPTIITSGNGADFSGKTTSPASDHPSIAPIRPVQKLSPFRVFHRSSGKRARDSPPASLPQSPTATAVLTPDAVVERPVSPLSIKTDPKGEDIKKPTRSPKIPSFLDLSPHGMPCPPCVCRRNT